MSYRLGRVVRGVARWSHLAVIFVASTTFAAAQGAPAASAPVAADDEAHRTDLLDLYRAWRHRPPPAPGSEHGPHWTLVPIIASRPSTGFRVGAAADVELKLGNPQETRFSTITSSFSYSTRKQVNISENFRLYGRRNRWIFDGQNHYAGSASDNVTFGTASTANLSPDIRYYSTRLFDTFYFRLTGNLYAGGGLYVRRQSQIEPHPEDSPDWTMSPFSAYSIEHGFNLEHQTSAGAGGGLLFDNRDNPADAVRGWYALADYRSVLARVSWRRLRLDRGTLRSADLSRAHDREATADRGVAPRRLRDVGRGALPGAADVGR